MPTETKQATYLQLISKDEKEVKVESLKIKAQEASIEVQREIMNLNSQLAKSKSALTAVKRSVPYDVKKELMVVETIESLEAKLAYVQKVKEERFSDVSI